MGKVNTIKTGRFLFCFVLFVCLFVFLLPATGGSLQKSSLYIFKTSYYGHQTFKE